MYSTSRSCLYAILVWPFTIYNLKIYLSPVYFVCFYTLRLYVLRGLQTHMTMRCAIDDLQPARLLPSLHKESTRDCPCTELGILQSSPPLPHPLFTLCNAFLSLDQMVLETAISSVSSLMSAFIITVLLVSGLALTLFLALQIRVELTHYVTMMTTIWNRTLSSNPQLME